MKINKNLSLIFFLTALVLCIGVVSSATASTPTSSNITVVTPGASGSISGATYSFNCTMDYYSDQNWTEATIYLESAALTANTSSYNAGTFTNDSSTTPGQFNDTIDVSYIKLEDGNDYIFTCEVYNGTDKVNGTRTGVTVDNTIPQSASSLTPTSDTDGAVTFSGTVVGSNTTACTLYFSGINPGSSSYTMTHTGNTCSYSHSSVPDQTYVWYIQASDGTNTTNSNTQTTNVDVTTSAGKAAVLIQEKGVSSAGGALLSISRDGALGLSWTTIIIVLVVVGIIIAIVKKR